MTTPVPFAITVSRETEAGRVHASTPASIDGGAVDRRAAECVETPFVDFDGDPP
jgi:hypothetical protein